MSADRITPQGTKLLAEAILATIRPDSPAVIEARRLELETELYSSRYQARRRRRKRAEPQ